MIPKKCDVIVIGGGPAGAMSSSLLAKEGFDVVLLEKNVFPRPKVGESLIPHFWKYMDLIGVSEKIENEKFVSKSGGCSYWNEKLRTVKFSDFGYKRPGLHVERDRFDQILLDQAQHLGVRVFYNVKAKDYVFHNEISQVNFTHKEAGDGTISAKFVVDATGQNSLVSNLAGIRTLDDDYRFHAFWGYYKNGYYIDNSAALQPIENKFKIPPITLVSSIGDWGWVWHIVLRNRISVGVILPRKNLNKFKEGGTTLAGRFNTAVAQTPILNEMVSSESLDVTSVSSIRDYAYRTSKKVHHNCFLTGDAAAFVDPINSAGIATALYSGFLSAWTIKNAFHNPRRLDSMKEIYTEKLTSRLEILRLLAFPSETLSHKSIQQASTILKQFSKSERHLAITQLLLMQRSIDLPDKLGLKFKDVTQEYSLEEVLASKKILI